MEVLGWRDLVKLVVLCSIVFWVDEGRKWLKYGKGKIGLGGRIGGGYS